MTQDHLVSFHLLRCGLHRPRRGCHSTHDTSSVIPARRSDKESSVSDQMLSSFREFSMVGLMIIAFGTGGIKPCVSSFGGDQFVRPQQDKQLEQYFSVFYFAINAGSLISTFVTPILREDVHCFGDDSCYSLAFGLPAILMVVAIGNPFNSPRLHHRSVFKPLLSLFTVVFVLGKPMYKILLPQGNIMGDFVKCIGVTTMNVTTRAIF